MKSPFAAPHSNLENQNTFNPEPKRLGGWLIFFLLILASIPIRISYFLVTEHWQLVTSEQWKILITPGSLNYSPLWEPLIWLEIVGNILTIILAITVLIYFIKKSQRTPKLVIILLIWSVVFTATDLCVFLLLPTEPDVESFIELARSLAAAFIWIPYFLISKRVKATFVL